MKKLLAIFALLPLLTWAFPVYTNRLDFDPAQSTGAFDDFLWRWSGYDDQRVEFFFKDVTVSNVGFRLAYPQRGKTFLDVLPPATTNQIVVITNEVLDVYTNFYPAIYNRATDRGFTNITETLNYSNGVFLSRSVVTNSSKVGSVQNTTLALAASSVITTQSSAVATTTAYGPYTNAYVQSQNTTITVSNFLENARFNVQLYDAWLNGDYQSASVSPNQFTPSGFDFPPVTLTSSYSVVSGRYYSVTGSVSVSKASASAADTYTRAFDVTVEPSGRKVLSIFGGLVGSAITYNFEANSFRATNTGSLLIRFSPRYTGQNFTNNIYSVNNFSVAVASTTNIYQSISTNVVTLVATNVAEFYAPSTQRVSKIYSKTETPYSQVTFSVPRLSVPPDGPYFAEVLTYTGANITNPSQSRTLAKGQVTVENSLWAITNYAGYTNYAGPWDYLLLNGSRPMAGDLNMGGSAVTNAIRFGFADGSSIAASNVALWNSFLAGTNVGLTANTEFDGNVTGKWNNLTLRKNALDNMDYLDFNASPTGTVQAERMQWDSGRSTAKLGLNANVNLDVGQQLMLYAKSVETNTLAKGEVVFVSGATGDNPTIKRASNASEALSARTIGITAESISSNANGFVVTRGTIYNVNTTNFTQGATLYLGVNGTLQTNLPAAPNHGVFVGTVERVGQNNGQIYVAIQNYQELEELSDVNVSSRTTNDLLIYNGTVWTNYARTNLALQSSLGSYLPLTGGTMSGSIYIDSDLSLNPSDINGFGRTINFEEAYFAGDWTFITEPTIPGYLTVTGAAATYVELNNLPAGIVTTNNLSTIAGSGLGVVSNTLVVTNVVGMVTTNDIANFITNAAGWSAYAATQTINASGFGMSNANYVTFQFYTNTFASIANFGAGAIVRTTSGSATNELFYYRGSGLPFQIWHNGNFNASSYLTISAGNANYWRITTAPTGATASGSSGQMAVSGTNLFIYSPNALGTGTGRWGRVNLNVSW